MWGQIFNLENPLIGADNTWVLWAVVVLGAGLAICLEQRYTWAAKMTGAVLALIFAIILSNFQTCRAACPPYVVPAFRHKQYMNPASL